MAHDKVTAARSTDNGLQECALTGYALLETPFFNKGSAFTEQERHEFGLTGLLPSRVSSFDEQVRRAYEQFQSRNTPLEKNVFMTSIKYQNEVLYYRLLQDHLKEMFSIIYTPTEGEAIANYSRIFRRPEGCFINIDEPDDIEAALDQFGPPEGVDIIACSDGEQILGIGDQGVGGVLISVAKLVLYALCAGLNPHRCLPVVLDVGTDNQELLNDDLYLGLRHQRIRGQRYDDFVNRFLMACRKRFPHAYIHFEDFGLANARRILDRYSPDFACFNDDIQGTGCVTLAGLYAAASVAKFSFSHLKIVIFGAGTAGTGIADQIRDAIAVESGKSSKDAAEQVWCVDKPGLLLANQSEELTDAQKGYARRAGEWQGSDRSLLKVIETVKPHVLIGTSTRPKSFTKEIVQEMAKHTTRPIIFPLSNPTRLHEAEPKDLFEWTDGQVLTATGSPFPPVESNGASRDISECNNSVIFPGIGLGAVLCRARLVTSQMLVAAVKALARESPAIKDPTAGLLPDVSEVRNISVLIAAAVIKQAVDDGVAQASGIPSDGAELEQWVKTQMWSPVYKRLVKVDKGDASRQALGKFAGA